MKRIALLITYLALVLGSGKTYAQGGIITTVAGCNLCIGSPADGTAATFASFNGLASMCLDTSGAIYVSDIGNSRVRWVNKATNLIYTIAGTTSSGFGGDGGSAATAQLNTPDGIYIDEANNLYIADAGNNRIRKVNISTGIITTFAGGGASTADGVAANTESITNPRCVYADATGNVYLGDGNKIRKVNSTGIITTVAGNGTAGDAGDGGLALSAGIAGPVRSISMDGAGNIYFTTNSRARVRKINVATGVISTVAGGGDCIVDGVPATDALLTVHSCVADAAGNIIIGDVSLQSLRFVQVSTGKIYTIGGGVSATGSGVLNENIPALSAYMYGYSLYLNGAEKWPTMLPYLILIQEISS
jgi:hypothetical protein